MKTILMLLAPLLLSVGADKTVTTMPVASDLPTFQAIVLSLTETTALVEAQSGDYVRNGDQFTFSIQNLPATGVRAGDTVLLTYTGFIQETWPAQIEVTDWRVLTSGTSTTPLTGLTVPTLSLGYGGQTLALPGDIDTWTYWEEDEIATTICECRTHPMDRQVPYPAITRTTDNFVSLSFTTSPDTVTIRCWPAALAGTQEGDYDRYAVSLHWNGKGFALPAGTEDLVLEVYANWKERQPGVSFGTASYIFSLSESA